MSRSLPRLLLVLGTLLPIAAGCGRRETPVERGIQTQTLLLGNGADPATLDPPEATAYTDMNIINALFEGLTFIDERTTKPVPAVATSWEPSPNGMTWTFHLRPNARWSNGDPVVAEDFVESYRRVVLPALAMENASYLFPLKNAQAINAGRIKDPSRLGCAAPDPHTLVLTLEHRTPHLPLLTALTPWYPVDPGVLRRFGAMSRRGTRWTRPGRLVGNGPFVLTEWTPRSRVVVTRSPTYWNSARTALRRIEFFPIDDPNAEENAFRAGQLHVTFSLPAPNVRAWRRRDPAELRIDPFLKTTFLEFNTTKPPFDDVRVRRAFALAIDRRAIAHSALGGSRLPAFSATPPGTGGYTAEARIGCDAAKARALLAAAGHPSGYGIPPLALQVRNNELQPTVAEAMQAMWMRTLGVRVSITPLEQKTWLRNQRQMDYTLSTYSWIGDFPDPLTFLGLFTSGNDNNWTGWHDPGYDAWIAAASGGADPARRDRLFQRAEALLLESAPVTPLYHGAQTFLIRPSVRNWYPALLGSRRYQFVRLAR